MNKNCMYLLLYLFLFSLSLYGSDAPKVIIAMNAWEPIKYETEPYGVLAQITKEAFALEGVEVEFRVAPWKRGYDYVLNGQWHGIVGWNSTDEREKLFFVSTPVLIEKVVFFHHKDLSLDWNTVEDLQGLSVGIISGYNYGPDLQRAIDDNIVNEDITASEENSIKMLDSRRFDIWPCEIDVGLFLIQKYLPENKAEQLTFNPNPIQISDLCLLLSREIPENADNLDKFEKGLVSLKESGRFREIIEEFLPGSYAY